MAWNEEPKLAPVGADGKAAGMKSAVISPARRGKPAAKKTRFVAKPRALVLDPIDAIVGLLKADGRRTDEIMRELRGR